MYSLKKVLEQAQASGIKDLVLSRSVSTTASISVDNGVHEETNINSDSSFGARGAVNGHSVTFAADEIDKEMTKMMIKSMLEQKDYSKEYNPDWIVPAEAVTEKRKTTYCHSSIAKMSIEDMVKIGSDTYNSLKQIDDKIINIVVEVEKVISTSEFLNSKGLSFRSKDGYFVVSAFGVAKKGEELVSGGWYDVYGAANKFKLNKFVKEFKEQLLSKLGGKKGVPGSKTCLLTPNCGRMAIGIILSHLSMFSIDQHLSLLEGKLDQKVFSENLTVTENPNSNNMFSTPYDSEGYPTQNKVLIEKGVVKTYLYDQEMAQKYNHAPTGNGQGLLTVHPGCYNYVVKNGERKSKDMIKSIEDGYVITSLEGAHAGLNPQNGNFTLSAEGFYVKNGKKKFPVNQFTVSGNIVKMLDQIKEVSKDTRNMLGTEVPYLLIEDLVISC